MKQKLYNLIDRDELALHKIGFVFGALLGITAGLLISDRADVFQVVLEEVVEDEQS